MAGASPTQRSLEYCRKLGMRAGVVERWIPRANVRKDLFGFIDLVVLRHNVCVGVQATTTDNISKRVDKILEECWKEAEDWLACDCAIEVWGWAKRGPAGKCKLWTLKRRAIIFEPDGTLGTLDLD